MLVIQCHAMWHHDHLNEQPELLSYSSKLVSQVLVFQKWLWVAMGGRYLGPTDRLMQQRSARFAGSPQLPVVLCNVPAMT